MIYGGKHAMTFYVLPVSKIYSTALQLAMLYRFELYPRDRVKHQIAHKVIETGYTCVLIKEGAHREKRGLNMTLQVTPFQLSNRVSLQQTGQPCTTSRVGT
jgi:hypothetical protein